VNDFDAAFDNAVKEHRFSLVNFHIRALWQEIVEIFTGGPEYSIDDFETVINYFQSQEKDEESRRKVEAILEAQVKEAYREAGIYNPFPFQKIQFTFPPVNFHLDAPPLLIVVSPRDRIERYHEALLVPDMSLESIEALENTIEQMGYSALVIRLGGVATYPAYVSNNTSLKNAIEIGAEEWMHQYLAFTPLGFQYVLKLIGINKDKDIVTINETVAGIVSSEISNNVYQRYYITDMEKDLENEENQEKRSEDAAVFDFNATMREIRLKVDAMLAAGEIIQAEQYMAERRDYLEANGYYIRKLNQAYFAFHGSYADSPISVDPIGEKLDILRARSDNLQSFVSMVSSIKNIKDLDALLP